MGCKFSKKIWDLLEVTHVDTSEVKRSKIGSLMPNENGLLWNLEKASKRCLLGIQYY